MDNFMIKSLFPVEFCYVLRYIVMLDNVWAWTHITNRQCSELTCCVVYGVLLLLVVTCHSNAFQKVSQSRCCRHLRHVILFQKVWNYCIPLASQPNAMSSTQWQKESQHNSAQTSQWSRAWSTLEDNVLQNEPSYNWAPLWIWLCSCNSCPELLSDSVAIRSGTACNHSYTIIEVEVIRVKIKTSCSLLSKFVLLIKGCQKFLVVLYLRDSGIQFLIIIINLLYTVYSSMGLKQRSWRASSPECC